MAGERQCEKFDKKIRLQKKVKDGAKQIVDTIYNIDKFERIRNLFVNGTNIKIDTSSFNMAGNPLRYVFMRNDSTMYDENGEGKARVFL